MKQTVGILTTYFAANYGAMLQPFALKRTLESLGCEVEILRYKQEHIYRHYNPFLYEKFFSPWYRPHPWYPVRVFFPAAIKEFKFRRFMNKYLSVKTGFDKQVRSDKDLYFIGSDQLWRKFENNWFDDVYLGFFHTKPGAKKIAYAVSGEKMEFTDANIRKLKDAFENFSLISLREKDIADNYRKHIGTKEIEVVLDPTLLADPKIYREIRHINPLPHKKFCFLYFIRSECEIMLDKIYKYCQNKGMDLVILSEGVSVMVKQYFKGRKGVHYLPSGGEEEFLGAIENAECVFTPSFHGTAFSIIYHKRFYSLMLNDGHDTRAKNILSELHLSDRLLSLSDNITDSPVDYSKADKMLEKLRFDSLDFIHRALKS